MKKTCYKKGIVFGIIVLIIGVSFANTSWGFSINKSQTFTFDGNTLYVGGSGPGNYTTIQGAIDDAVDGDTIFVFDESSPYYEHVVIEKAVHLLGEDKNTTIIDGEYVGHVVQIRKNNVTISGFTVQRGGESNRNSAILIESDNNLIQDNIIFSNRVGIHLNAFDDVDLISNNTIKFNNIVSNGHGIYMAETCNNNIIYKNNISKNADGISIYNLGSPPPEGNIISYNNINNNTVGIWVQDLRYNQICYNNINYNSQSFFLILAHNLEIKCNNIIGNEEDALFLMSVYNKWDGNYWNRARLFPKIIRGSIILWLIFGEPKMISWINIDWHPAKEPYDI